MGSAPAKPIDKSGWGPGPWQDEPDRIEWEHAGLPCLMIRHHSGGHWCGYVGLPPGHPFYGKSDSEIPYEPLTEGLTYSGACRGHICHVPKPGEPDNVWWLGFDCAHSGDMSPGYEALSERMGFRHDWEVYRTAEEVKQRTQRLAEEVLGA